MESVVEMRRPISAEQVKKVWRYNTWHLFKTTLKTSLEFSKQFIIFCLFVCFEMSKTAASEEKKKSSAFTALFQNFYHKSEQWEYIFP